MVSTLKRKLLNVVFHKVLPWTTITSTWINDLTFALENYIFHRSADGTNLIFDKKDSLELSYVVNIEPRCLTDWIRANKLSLNKYKTKLLNFRPTSNNSTSNILLVVKIEHETKWPFINSCKVLHISWH